MATATPTDDRPPEALPTGDPDHVNDFAEAADDSIEDVAAGVSEEDVAAFWENFGTIVNRFAPTPEWAPDAWLLSPAEVQALTVASTPIANARAPMLSEVVAKHSAEAALGIHLVGYVRSNLAKIRPPDEEPPPPVFAPAGVTLDDDGNVIEVPEPAPEICASCQTPAPDHAAGCPEATTAEGDRQPYFTQPGFPR